MENKEDKKEVIIIHPIPTDTLKDILSRKISKEDEEKIIEIIRKYKDRL